jgi:Spt4/RpoE2 zinc finger
MNDAGGDNGDYDEEENIPQQVADLADASVPNQMRGIRACKRCGILKTLDQFLQDGCENCPFLDMVCVCKLHNIIILYDDVCIIRIPKGTETALGASVESEIRIPHYWFRAVGKKT